MDGEKFNFLTLPNGSTDTATAMAMMNNNPWMYLVMLALFANGGFGFGGNRNGNIEAQLASMQNQINDNNNNAIAREAVQGNGFAISQLAQNLNVDRNALEAAINSVNFNIANLGSQTGMGFMGVTNAINLGQLNMVQQLKDCCCAMQKQTLEQGYQGRIETIQQTDDIKTAIRVENGLTRTEVAAFRQAWENARYQDVVAEKTRLQTELDLLRQQDANTAALANFINPLKQQMQLMEWQMQQYIVNPKGASVTTASAGA
jgi:hypothetical protein